MCIPESRVGKFGYLEVQCNRCSIKFSIDGFKHINVIVLMPIKRILHNFSHSDPSIEKDVNYQFIEMNPDILKKKDCCGNQNMYTKKHGSVKSKFNNSLGHLNRF